MVRFKFQLTDVVNECYRYIQENIQKNKWNFLNINLIFERNHLEDDFKDEIIHRIFGYKFVLRMVYSFSSGEVI